MYMIQIKNLSGLKRTDFEIDRSNIRELEVLEVPRR